MFIGFFEMTAHASAEHAKAPVALALPTRGRNYRLGLDLDRDRDRDRDGKPVALFLNHAMSGGASAQNVAELVTNTFHEIAQVLAPIIGQQGMEALYRRSLQLAGSMCAQLHATSKVVSMALNLELLKVELAKQTAAVAASAGSKLLHVFHELLASLIGTPLTERLLGSFWLNFLGASSARTAKS